MLSAAKLAMAWWIMEPGCRKLRVSGTTRRSGCGGTSARAASDRNEIRLLDDPEPRHRSPDHLRALPRVRGGHAHYLTSPGGVITVRRIRIAGPYQATACFSGNETTFDASRASPTMKAT